MFTLEAIACGGAALDTTMTIASGEGGTMGFVMRAVRVGAGRVTRRRRRREHDQHCQGCQGEETHVESFSPVSNETGIARRTKNVNLIGNTWRAKLVRCPRWLKGTLLSDFPLLVHTR